MKESGSIASKGPAQTPKRRRLAGFPGENQGVLTVLHYTGSKAHLNVNGPAGAPGLYTVEFVLAKPDARNAPENEFRFADQRRGDSHLAITKPAVTINIDPTELLLHFQSPSSPSLVFHGYPNDAGYLAKLKSDPFHAANRGEAERVASTGMRSLLSNLSAQLDIPLIIELVEVTELATNNRGIIFTAPFPVTGMAVSARENPDDRELRHTMALYREALNSNTPIYRFLGFYKIIETSVNRWNRLDPEQKTTLGPQRKGERIPAGTSRAEMEQWLAALFHVNRDWDDGILQEKFIPEVRGRKITNIYENQLRELRHKVAHGSLDSGDFLLLDESDDRGAGHQVAAVPEMRGTPKDEERLRSISEVSGGGWCRFRSGLVNLSEGPDRVVTPCSPTPFARTSHRLKKKSRVPFDLRGIDEVIEIVEHLRT